MYKKLFFYSVVLACLVLPGAVFAADDDESDDLVYAANVISEESNAPPYEHTTYPKAPARAAPLTKFDDAGKGDLALKAQHVLEAMEFPGDRNLFWVYIVNKPWEGGTRPEKLNDFVGIHPRLLLNQEKVDELKVKIAVAGSMHQKIWLKVKTLADGYMTKNPGNNPGNEDATRLDGDTIPNLAIAYLMTGNSAYANKAVSWMTTVCNYTTSGLPNWQGNRGLGAGSLLKGVSLGYDWLYNYMTPAQRLEIKTRLNYFANRMAASSNLDSPLPQHREKYLTNHCQVEYGGLATAGFALYDDTDIPNAEDWIRKAYNIYCTAFDCYGSDGCNTEGNQYYALTLDWQCAFDKMAKELLGRDFYGESKWLQNTGYFMLYSTLPNFTTSNHAMQFGDSSYNRWVHGPTHQLFNLAGEYRNPVFQWLAMEMINRSIGTTHAMTWGGLIWYDETVTPLAPTSTLLPTARHFKDVGWFTSRSDWSDANAVMVGFKCGPMHGHRVQPYYFKEVDENWPETVDHNNWDLTMKWHTIVNGHAHADVGQFDVYAYGKWLAIDDFAAARPKATWNHSTILVNGTGQFGEGDPINSPSWFYRDQYVGAKATSMIVKVKSKPGYEYLIGDAMNGYKDPNLTGFRRHFVYIKPDVVIIADELKAAVNTDLQSRLNVALGTTIANITGATIAGAGDNYVVTNGNVCMDVQFVHLQPIITSIGTQASTGVALRSLRANFASSGSDLLVSVLHPRMNTDAPSVITQSSISGSVINLTIQCGARTVNVSIDVAADEVEVL